LTQREDALVADAALLPRLRSLGPDDRDRFSSAMGTDDARLRGVRRDAPQRPRLPHTWDIEVVGDPEATLPEQVATLVFDTRELVARFSAKPTGQSETVTVATTTPARTFAVDLSPDTVMFRTGSDGAEAALELPRRSVRPPPLRTPPTPRLATTVPSSPRCAASSSARRAATVTERRCGPSPSVWDAYSVSRREAL
jgi:hypothetical protein